MKQKAYLIGIVAFAILSAGTSCFGGSPPELKESTHFLAPADAKYNASDMVITISSFDAVNNVFIHEPVILIDVTALAPTITIYKRKKFISHNKRLNTYNIMHYGKKAKQKDYGALITDELTLYNDEDIIRPAWKIPYASLIKLDA